MAERGSDGTPRCPAHCPQATDVLRLLMAGRTRCALATSISRHGVSIEPGDKSREQTNPNMREAPDDLERILVVGFQSPPASL